jgi:hypothetical protein
VVPFTFRPDLLIVWLISALVTVLTVLVVLLAGSVIEGRH